MITPNEYIKDGKYMGAEMYYGLSSDQTKPAGVGNGSVLIEMDTSTIFFYDAESGDWLEWGAEE